ncbi:PE/PPE C-terminal domain-containing protein, partial [Mycobacterium sp. E188]|uniref:PE/PPE C-terminal domain-containing protein n=1 Tax=Mycobacterium sp. E188 TaxID=1834130 RepID=UPI000A76DAAD
PDGVAEQALAVTQAAQQPAGNTAQTVASQLASTQLVTTAAPQVTTPTSQTGPFTWLTSAIQNFTQSGLPTPTNNYLGLSPTFYTVMLKQNTGLAYFSNGIVAFWSQLAQQLVSGPGGTTAGAGGAWFPTPQFAQLGLGNLGSLSSNVVSAGAGQATQVGGLSVPQQWATLTSAVSPANAEAEALPVQAGAAGNPPGNALLRGMPTGVMGRRAGAAAGYSHKYGFRYSVLTRPPSAG